MADDDAFEDLKVCKVYDHEDFFTVVVQMLLAFFALMSLWFKRENETPRRKFRTWLLDVSKQALGATYAHVCNMLIAAIMIKSMRGDVELQDQCAWYGISYLIDTTLGLVLAIWGLKIVDWLAHSNDWASLKHSGVYEGVDGILHWIHQVVAWLLILTIVKIIIYYFMVFTSGALAWAGAILFAPFQSNIRFELLFVMIFFPGVLNVIYFWIADSYLQAGKEHTHAHEAEETNTGDMEITSDKKEQLLSDEDKEEADPKTWTNVDGQQVSQQIKDGVV